MTVRILQGYFDEESRCHIEPPADAVDIRFNLDHPLYEYNLFKTFLANGVMNPAAGPVGLLSWKFQTKTLVSTALFRDFCEKAFAIGADVAFINPMIGAEAIYVNVWEQGQTSGHGGMSDVVEALFPNQVKITFMPKSVFAFCNYFVGNERYWTKYIAFCDKVLAQIESFRDARPELYELINGSANYYRNERADFRPFILERLFSTFLLLDPEITCVPFEYDAAVYDKKFGVEIGRHLRLLSGLKNESIMAKDQKRLDLWDEARCRLLDKNLGIGSMDDPTPKPHGRKQDA